MAIHITQDTMAVKVGDRVVATTRFSDHAVADEAALAVQRRDCLSGSPAAYWWWRPGAVEDGGLRGVQPLPPVRSGFIRGTMTGIITRPCARLNRTEGPDVNVSGQPVTRNAPRGHSCAWRFLDGLGGRQR